MYRKSADDSLESIINNLQFTDVLMHKLIGRYPKISMQIEKTILGKILSRGNPIASLIKKKGSAIFYRATGGRYFKVITNYPTGSSKEKKLYFDKRISNCIGAILSSSLFFGFYQIYSNNRDMKLYEINMFTIPVEKLTDNVIRELESLYTTYLEDIEKNVNIRQGASKSFKEYKIGCSKGIIDRIDDKIAPLYNLTSEEIKFIKEYEIKYRM